MCCVFAGSEWDYVILSMVRSLPKSQIEKKPTLGWKHRYLGFITDSHQINVALTRARKGIIIIGKFPHKLQSLFQMHAVIYVCILRDNWTSFHESVLVN